MKTRALVAALLLSLSGLGGLGCAASGAAVRPGATEHQTVTKARYAIAPVSFEGFTVDGVAEEAWLATQGQAQRTQWESDKQGLALELSELMHDDATSFHVAGAELGAHGVVELRLVSYESGVFQFVVTARGPDGCVVAGPSLVTTRKGAQRTVQLGYRPFVMQAASVIAMMVTHGEVPVTMARVDSTREPVRGMIADAASASAPVAGPLH